MASINRIVVGRDSSLLFEDTLGIALKNLDFGESLIPGQIDNIKSAYKSRQAGMDAGLA